MVQDKKAISVYSISDAKIDGERGQQKHKRKCAFVEACYIVQEYIQSDEELTRIEKQYWNSFIRFDYTRWVLTSWKDWAITQ